MLCTVVSDGLLYDVGKEVCRDWKKLAKSLGLTSQEIDNIKSEAKSSRKRAGKMLQLWHSKMRSILSVGEIQETLQRMRRTKQTKQQTESKLLCSLYLDCE